MTPKAGANDSCSFHQPTSEGQSLKLHPLPTCGSWQHLNHQPCSRELTYLTFKSSAAASSSIDNWKTQGCWQQQRSIRENNFSTATKKQLKNKLQPQTFPLHFAFSLYTLFAEDEHEVLLLLCMNSIFFSSCHTSGLKSDGDFSCFCRTLLKKLKASIKWYNSRDSPSARLVTCV